MRLLSRYINGVVKSIDEHNRKIISGSGLELMEKKIEREFKRLGDIVEDELKEVSRINRFMYEETQIIQTDFQQTKIIPIPLPDWTKTIESVAAIKHKGDQNLSRMLEVIHQALTKQYRDIIEQYRKDILERFELLKKIKPCWEVIGKKTISIENKIALLNQRLKRIDQYIENYEKMRSHAYGTEKQIYFTSITQLIISFVIMTVFLLGGVLTFNSIQQPLFEILGGASYIVGIKTSDLASIFLIFLQIAMGIFLVDSLKISRYFSIIGSMEEKIRRFAIGGIVIVLIIIFSLHCLLVLVNQDLTSNLKVLHQSLSGVGGSSVVTNRIPLLGQVVMLLIFQFTVTFVIIPVEAIFSSGRCLVGVIVSLILKIVSIGLRLVGNISHSVGRTILRLYDLCIIPGLWLEGFLRKNETIESNEFNLKSGIGK
jgi:hypothetical protein